jgi:hypothetical protein
MYDFKGEKTLQHPNQYLMLQRLSVSVTAASALSREKRVPRNIAPLANEC